jgi:hypothetical protein
MHEAMGAVLFTENNVMRFPQILDDVEPRFRVGNILEEMKDKAPAELYSGLPIWNNFFDWYEPEPDHEDFQAVTLAGPGGVFEKKISVLHFPAMELVPKTEPIRVEPHRRKPEPGKQNPRYVRHDVTKVPRQGEFDNLHQAPKMFLADALLNRPDNKKRFAAHQPDAGEPGKPGASGSSWGLEHVTMAPFCVHDCFHTHWRWSQDFKFDFVAGWGPNFDPYVKFGAPLIPDNQSLNIKYDRPGTVAFTSTIHGPEAGRWQVANHFGSAYALKLLKPSEKIFTNSINLMAQLLEEPLIEGVNLNVSWTRFYWRLRYGGTDDQPMERLKVTAAERDFLRKAGL